MGVEYLSKLISNNLLRLDCCSHELWNQGFVVSAKYNHIEIVKLINVFGVSHGILEALQEAVKSGSHSVLASKSILFISN